MKMGRRIVTHKHGFEGRNIRESSYFDDRILDSSKMRHTMKGKRKLLHMREFNADHGDYEGFFRGVEVLVRLWSDKEAMADSIVALSDICITMTGKNGMSGLTEALNSNFYVWTLDGVNIPALAAWGAICWVHGADLRDCVRLINHEEGTRQCLIRMFNNFDMDDPTRYTRSEFENILNEYKVVV